MSWTDERVELLKRLWADGWSCSQIASELGGVSRNGVIGKVHRMNLVRRYHNRGTDGAATKKARKPRAKANLNVFRTPPVTESFSTAPIIEGDHLAHIEAPTGPRVSILELSDKRCRWPIGEGRDVSYCGASPAPNKPYCPFHSRVAYQKPQKPDERTSERTHSRRNFASI